MKEKRLVVGQFISTLSGSKLVTADTLGDFRLEYQNF